VTIHYIKKSNYPLSFFGLTLRNWKKNLLEAVLFTIPILVLCTYAKWLWLKHMQIDAPLLVAERLTVHRFLEGSWDSNLMLLYLLCIPLQEFISRGGIQSAIYSFIPGRFASSRSILLASLIFASFHAFITIYFALAVFVLGIFWGWLYARQKSLIGPSVAHLIVSWWTLEILDAFSFLT
jgi:membrane protease YdiL (CAAX protease family)